LVYSVPQDVNDTTFLIIHAYGETPKDLDNNPRNLEFTRKVIITPFYFWRHSALSTRKGRIRLWQ